MSLSSARKQSKKSSSSSSAASPSRILSAQPTAEWPNIVRPAGTPGIGPRVENTMDNHYDIVVPKGSVTMEKKRRYSVAKADLIQQVQSFKTHHDPRRPLSAEQLDKLPQEDLVRQALKLMTIDDPHGVRTTGGVSIEQLLTSLINNATDRAGQKLAKIVREHKKGLQDIAKVQKFQKDTTLEGINENASEEHDDGYHENDINNPIFNDSDDSDIEFLSMLNKHDGGSNSPPNHSSALSRIGAGAKAQKGVQGQRNRVPTAHYRPESTATKKKKESASATVAATSSSTVSGASVASVLPPALPSVNDPALLCNSSNSQVSTDALPASSNGATEGATGVADIDITAGTHSKDVGAALMSTAEEDKGLTTQAVGELHHSSSDDDSVPGPSQWDRNDESSSEDSSDGGSVPSQQSNHAERQQESYDGYDSDLLLACFKTVPTANVLNYRAPGSSDQGQHGPLTLLEVHLPPAEQHLSVGVHDGQELDIGMRDLSFERRAKLLHQNWKMMQDLQSMDQIRQWLENMEPLGHIYLVHVHAAFLNSKPDVNKTFGETKRLFWNLVNSCGSFQNDRLIIEHSVALTEVTVEYLIVRPVSEWAVFMTQHCIVPTDFWDMAENQALRFATLGETVYPSFTLCIASLIQMVNFCSTSYRKDESIERLLQRQVFRCRNAPESGLKLAAADAHVVIRSYFDDVYVLPAADAALSLLERAIDWVKSSSLSTVAVQITINDRWLTLLSALFLPDTIQTRDHSIHDRIRALVVINPRSFSNEELRHQYPTIYKTHGCLLLEYLNHNSASLLLYGQSTADEAAGVLRLKLMGSLVWILQDFYQATNVDALLSASDVAYLMHSGGVLAATNITHHFDSQVFTIFEGHDVSSQLRSFIESNLKQVIKAVPRQFDKLVSRQAWRAYYNHKLITAEEVAKQALARMQSSMTPVRQLEAFASVAPLFIAPTVQDSALTDMADSNNYVRHLAAKVKNWYTTQQSSRLQRQEFNRGQPQSSRQPTLPATEQPHALFDFPPPVNNEQALFGDDFQVTLIDQYSAYVNPSMYAVHQQQRIERWDTVINYAFAGMGNTYIRSLSLHSTQQRPFELNDNVVFLYDLSAQFTPSNPFPSIFAVTHVWYKLVKSAGTIHYFDKVGILYRTMDMALLPVNIKCDTYVGTYLLFTPPSSSPPPAHPTRVSAPAEHPSRSTVMDSARSALLSVSAAVSHQQTSASTSGSSTVRPSQVVSSVAVLSTAPPSSSTASTSSQPAVDYDSDDSEQRKLVKMAKVTYLNKVYPVLGKESVIKILRDTHSVRTLMEDNQLERLVQHEGNFVNNYTPAVFRAGILRQLSLTAVQTGMSLIVNENHDLMRFKLLACFDMTELQTSLYYLKHEFYYLQTSLSLHSVHYLTKLDAIACNFEIKTYDLWVKTWEGYRLVMKLILGPSYGLAIAKIQTDIQQNNIGQLFNVDYLVALSDNLKALIHQYSSSTEEFIVTDSTQIFQPTTMTSVDWQSVISLLWTSFKSRLTYTQQQEVTMFQNKYNQIRCKPMHLKVAKSEAPYQVPEKKKVTPPAQKKRKGSPPPAPGVKKVAFAADVNICISDIAKHYGIRTTLEECSSDCKYVHYNQLPSGMTKAVITTKVKKLAEKCGMSAGQQKYFLQKIENDKKFK